MPSVTPSKQNAASHQQINEIGRMMPWEGTKVTANS